MSEIALHPGDAEFSGNFEILRLIGELRDVFENNFDRTWFSLILDGIPVDLRTVRNIRDLVSLTTIYPGRGVADMAGDPGIGSLPCHGEAVSPPRPQGEARDSWLLPQKRVRDPHQYILRKFVAFTFPYNLERLRRLTLKLKAKLLAYYPSLS